jgi:hypothetical protein
MPPYLSRIKVVRKKFLDQALGGGPFNERTGHAKPDFVLDSPLVEIDPIAGQARGDEANPTRVPCAALPAIACGLDAELRTRQGDENANSYIPAEYPIRRVAPRPAPKGCARCNALKVRNYL